MPSPKSLRAFHKKYSGVWNTAISFGYPEACAWSSPQYSKRAREQIFSSAVQTFQEVSDFQASSFSNLLTSFLPTTPIPFLPCLSETQNVLDGEDIRWRHEGCNSQGGSLGRAVTSLRRGPHFGILGANGDAHRASSKHQNRETISFVDGTWIRTHSWHQSNALVLCCPNWWPLATCGYINENEIKLII